MPKAKVPAHAGSAGQGESFASQGGHGPGSYDRGTESEPNSFGVNEDERTGAEGGRDVGSNSQAVNSQDDPMPVSDQNKPSATRTNATDKPSGAV